MTKTLRDEIAIAAMQSMITGGQFRRFVDIHDIDDAVIHTCNLAYEFADAMIESKLENEELNND